MGYGAYRLLPKVWVNLTAENGLKYGLTAENGLKYGLTAENGLWSISAAT